MSAVTCTGRCVNKRTYIIWTYMKHSQFIYFNKLDENTIYVGLLALYIYIILVEHVKWSCTLGLLLWHSLHKTQESKVSHGSLIHVPWRKTPTSPSVWWSKTVETWNNFCCLSCLLCLSTVKVLPVQRSRCRKSWTQRHRQRRERRGSGTSGLPQSVTNHSPGAESLGFHQDFNIART